MSAAPSARVYLVTPPTLQLETFTETLAGLLDNGAIMCVRLGLAGSTEETLIRAADTLRPVCHARDVPLVLTDHFRLVRQLGLDGVHLSDGPRQVRAARKALGSDAIVGAYARASRHDGISAAEHGADYVSFGPVSPSSLGDGALAERDLFAWWSEMIEIPVVGEGGFTPELAETLAADMDFVALGDEIWRRSENPAAALDDFTRVLA